MAIQMRRGPLAQYDESKMLPGEWGISIDNDSDNQKAFISFAPGVSKEVMMVEDAEEQIAVATAEAIDMATEEAEAWAHGNSFRVNDYASGDGSTKSFTLAETPSSILGVYVDGSSVSAYTLSGKTITFTTAPASGSNNIRVYYTVNTTTDNAKYYKEQAEAVVESIPEDYSELSDDVDQLKNALPTKAEQDGAYPDLTAGQMLSKVEQTDSVPYNFRAVGHDATLEYTDAIVGGSVAWNQLVQNPNFDSSDYWSTTNATMAVSGNVVTVTASAPWGMVKQNYKRITLANHRYLVSAQVYGNPNIYVDSGVLGSKYLTKTNTWEDISFIVSRTSDNWDVIAVGDSRTSGWTEFKVKNICVFDLTQMFGTTIADYVYTLETATAGSGVAWLKKHFPKLFTYQEYNAGEIVSVEGISQHVMRDADNNIIHSYPLDSTVTLRGILKLDSNNQLYADGDRYLPDGTVQRRYGVVDLGTLNWTADGNRESVFYTNSLRGSVKNDGSGICSIYEVRSNTGVGGIQNMQLSTVASYGSGYIFAKNTSYTDAATFKTAMSGVMLVYELATPTTEEADPYTVPQIIDPDGTEEYVSTSIVPVGHESRYPLDIAGRLDKILTMPTANGTYTLRATVNNGAVTYAWVST